MTLEELKARRERLWRARTSGVYMVRIDGEEVTYKSDMQIAAAITALEAEIARRSRGPRPRTIYPQTTKGLT